MANEQRLPVCILPDPAALAWRSAQEFLERSTDAIAERGRFLVALSGGSTPQAMFTLLASPAFADQVDWQRVFVFWSDERCVPPEHPDSNYGMARRTLLAHVPIPAHNIHRIQAELEPAQAAAGYQALLGEFTDGEQPLRFDLIYLGMGEDGHTASLFPDTAAIHESQRWVLAQFVDKIGMWRITLTPPVLNSASHIRFFVQGSSKAQTLRQVLLGPPQVDHLPAQIIRPTHGGDLLWFIDRAAAQKLNLSQE